MSRVGKIKQFWPIADIVEETVTDKFVKWVEGKIWHLFSMGPRVYREADVNEIFWGKLKADYWIGNNAFAAQTLRQQISVLRTGNFLDTGVSNNDIPLMAITAASYALSGRRVHILKDGCELDDEALKKMAQYFKLLDLSFANMEATSEDEEDYKASIIFVSIETLMKEYLRGVVQFGSPRHFNHMNAAALKIDRWGQKGWGLKGLDVVLFPGARDYLVERPEWAAVHAVARENKWEDILIHRLIQVIQKEEYKDAGKMEELDEEVLDSVKAAMTSMGPLENSWCNDQVLFGWIKRVGMVCHGWVKDRDYKISNGVIVTTSKQPNEMIRIAAIQEQLNRPPKMQTLSRITLHRFLSSYHDLILWGSGLSAFSSPLWRMFRRPVVGNVSYDGAELILCLSEKEMIEKINKISALTGEKGQTLYLINSELMEEKTDFKNINHLKRGQSAPSGSYVVAVNVNLDPREIPLVQTDGPSHTVHMVTMDHFDKFLPEGFMGKTISKYGVRLSKISKALIYRYLQNRWINRHFALKQVLLDQERRMVHAIDITASRLN
jgi:hypothetical protein